MTRIHIIEPEANRRILLREALEQEGYDAAEAMNSAKRLQTADVALLEGVMLHIWNLIVW
jgi:DNA-binding response OmpR family regulator